MRQMSVGKDGFAVKVKDVLSAGGAGSNDSVLENGRWEVEDICKVMTVWLPLRVNEI